MGLKPNRVIPYRELARNLKSNIDSLKVGEIVEVRGPTKGIVCYLTKDIETITNRRKHGEQQSADAWL